MSVSPYVWLNDRLFPANEAGISPADRGFLLADGVFETLRVTQGKPAWPDLHFDRLEAGCKVLRLPLPQRSSLQKAMQRLITANALTDGSLRLTYTRGIGPRGLNVPGSPSPTLLLTTAPAPTPLPKPVRLHIPRQRRDETSPLCCAKTLSMLPSIVARLEAQEAGMEEALLLNLQGNLCEASAANFLALSNNQLLTPPLSDGPLPGTARRRLVEAGLCQEVSLRPADIPNFQAAWLITALGVVEVTAIHQTSLPLHPLQTEALRNFLER